MIVTDLYKPKSKYLYEGLDHQSLQTVMLWESVGQQIYEAQLTADQINLIFQYVEQGATAAGGNRTMIGKGKDAASAVNRAWEDLKTKVSTSAPIQGVDKLYDQAAAKLKQATGGDQGVMQYVQKYRDFAKKHPVAQSLIYSALIAAAGISGAGLGGAAALGLFKLVDKLLQGEKFSSAAYQGAKTGALAYGASKLGDLIKGQPAPDEVAQRAQNLPDRIPVEPDATATAVQSGANIPSIRDAASAGRQAASAGANDYGSIRDAAFDYARKLEATGMSPAAVDRAEQVFITAAKGELAQAAGGTTQMIGGQLSNQLGSALGGIDSSGIPAGSIANTVASSAADTAASSMADKAATFASNLAAEAPRGANMDPTYLQQVVSGEVSRAKISKEAAQAALDWQAQNGGPKIDAAPPSLGRSGLSKEYLQQVISGEHPRPMISKDKAAELLDKMNKANESVVRSGRRLSEAQINRIFDRVCRKNDTVLSEGPMDAIKGAAGKALGYLQTKGKNLTTKITADKLMQAWKKAGSPMDSLDVASIIQNAGVPSPIIKQVYGTMNIPFAGEPGAGPATQRNISVAGPQNTVRAQTSTAASTAAGTAAPAKTPTSTKSAAANPAAPAQTATSSAAGTTALDPADKTAKVGGAQAQVPYYGINPVTKKPWTVDELQAKASSTSTAVPATQTTPSASTAAASSAVPTTATSDATSAPASTSSSSLTPSQIRQQRQQAAAAVAQQQMKTSTTTTPSTTAATQPTPAEIRQQRQQAAAAVAQQQMAGGNQAAPSAPVGFDASNVMKLPGMPSTAKTAGAPTKFPSYGTAGQQGNYKPASVTASTTTALPKPTTTKITPSAPGAPTAPTAPAAPNVPGTYNPRTGAAQMGGKSMVAFKDLPAAVQKKIDPTLAEQVKHMLESVQTKKDVERIREYIDNYYNQTALTETVKTQRRKLMDHVTKVSAIRRRIYAQSIRN